MNQAEVVELLKKIKRKYPMFYLPKDEIDEMRALVSDWLSDLKDIPFNQAVENLKRHAATEEWPPSIARLSQPLNSESEMELEYMRKTATEYMTEVDSWIPTSVPPSDKVRERMKQLAAERTRNVQGTNH